MQVTQTIESRPELAQGLNLLGSHAPKAVTMFGNQLISTLFGQQAIQNPPPNYVSNDAIHQHCVVMKPDLHPQSFDVDRNKSQKNVDEEHQDESRTRKGQASQKETTHSTADWSNNLGWEVAEMFISAHVEEMTKKVFADEQQVVVENGERVLMEELTLDGFLSAVDHEPSILGWLDLYSMVF